jgi:hypothetical protein
MKLINHGNDVYELFLSVGTAIEDLLFDHIPNLSKNLIGHEISITMDNGDPIDNTDPSDKDLKLRTVGKFTIKTSESTPISEKDILSLILPCFVIEEIPLPLHVKIKVNPYDCTFYCDETSSSHFLMDQRVTFHNEVVGQPYTDVGKILDRCTENNNLQKLLAKSKVFTPLTMHPPSLGEYLGIPELLIVAICWNDRDDSRSKLESLIFPYGMSIAEFDVLCSAVDKDKMREIFPSIDVDKTIERAKEIYKEMRLSLAYTLDQYKLTILDPQ